MHYINMSKMARAHLEGTHSPEDGLGERVEDAALPQRVIALQSLAPSGGGGRYQPLNLGEKRSHRTVLQNVSQVAPEQNHPRRLSHESPRTIQAGCPMKAHLMHHGGVDCGNFLLKPVRKLVQFRHPVVVVVNRGGRRGHSFNCGSCWVKKRGD